MKKKLLGFYDYTVILTYCGMLFAFCGIMRAVSKNYWEAVFCLMLAGVCDMFDGAVAATKAGRTVYEKQFGIQIDSLSDLVSFGVLPGVFVYMVSGKNAVAGLVCALFVLSALIRLAYFNVVEEERQRQTSERRKSFQGMPVTTAAIFIPVLYLLYQFRICRTTACFPVLLVMMGIGYLLPVEIKKPGILVKAGILAVGFLEAAGIVFFMGGGTVMKGGFALWFLYRTVPGRILLKLLVQPRVSRMAGRFLSSSLSRWLVPFFIRRHGISMDHVEIPKGGFASFNAFFTRKRKTEYCDMTHGRLVSPCDGRLSVEKIRKDAVFDIKNTTFTMEDLLKDRKLAAEFQNGVLLVFRLTPQDYHRYCYAVDGKVLHTRKIQGKLHCVRPVALHTVPVFAQNSREYEVIAADRFGTVIQMEIGALLVGKIRNFQSVTDRSHVKKGDEKGYFAFSGSTVIIALQKDHAVLNEKLYDRLDGNGEIPVQKGEFIASVS